MFVYCYIATAIYFMNLNAFAMATYQSCIEPTNSTKYKISLRIKVYKKRIKGKPE